MNNEWDCPQWMAILRLKLEYQMLYGIALSEDEALEVYRKSINKVYRMINEM